MSRAKKSRDRRAQVLPLAREILHRAIRSDLSPAEWKVLAAVFIYAPLFDLFEDAVTIGQIAEEAGFSDRWTRSLLHRLESKGLVKYVPGSGRPPHGRGKDFLGTLTVIGIPQEGGTEQAATVPGSSDEKVKVDTPNQDHLSSEEGGTNRGKRGNGSPQDPGTKGELDRQEESDTDLSPEEDPRKRQEKERKAPDLAKLLKEGQLSTLRRGELQSIGSIVSAPSTDASEAREEL